MSRRLRVGIVGCGFVAEHHVKFLSRTGAQVVGVADVNVDAAKRFAEKCGARAYGSLDELLKTKLDVLHITTPPFYHYEQAKRAIEAGVNVLIEKPMTLTHAEAADLYRRAAKKGVLICPDFILLFHPRTREAFQIVQSGALGRVVRVECQYSLEQELARKENVHWSFGLPGGPMHDVFAHPLYLSLYLIGKPLDVHVTHKATGSLPQGLTDHIEITMEGSSATAHAVLSMATRPPTRFVRVQCERGSVTVDYMTMTVLVEKEGRLYRLRANLNKARQLTGSTFRNIYEHLTKRLVPYHGLHVLIEEFYAALASNGPAPVSQELALAVSEVEEQIVKQGGRLRLDTTARPSKQKDAKRGTVLVTGAAGYLGSAIVERLVKDGYRVRAFVRPLSRIDALERLGVEIRFGDIRNLADVKDAAKGADAIVHGAAALRGSRDFIISTSVRGTQNVAACTGAKRVIHIGSMGIYDYASLKNGDVMTEETPLESQPHQRGAATVAKKQAEEVALSHLSGKPPWTILRPGLVFGRGRTLEKLSGRRMNGLLLCLIDGKKPLAMVHADDVADAVIRALQNASSAGKVFNIVHPDSVILEDALRLRLSELNPKMRAVYVPHWFASTLILGGGTLLRAMKKNGPRTRQLTPTYRRVKVDTTAATRTLGWKPSKRLMDQLRD
ncbi:MAG: Gfo/Idh/MocA family oxidoreductase [Candidatus Aenigmatarchaeota archaeon]|nr:MAG: Gfo/Idh/MocA family oxidoreductase [Candidatus Aenigmarchaeota archaeon]